MESREQREPQGTPEDLEQGTPQDQLSNDDPGPGQGDVIGQEGVGAQEEGGADSPADAAREGG